MRITGRRSHPDRDSCSTAQLTATRDRARFENDGRPPRLRREHRTGLRRKNNWSCPWALDDTTAAWLFWLRLRLWNDAREPVCE